MQFVLLKNIFVFGRPLNIVVTKCKPMLFWPGFLFILERHLFSGVQVKCYFCLKPRRVLLFSRFWMKASSPKLRYIFLCLCLLAHVLHSFDVYVSSLDIHFLLLGVFQDLGKDFSTSESARKVVILSSWSFLFAAFALDFVFFTSDWCWIRVGFWCSIICRNVNLV